MKNFLAFLGLALLTASILTMLGSAFFLIWTLPEKNILVPRLLATGFLTFLCSWLFILITTE